jgi:hypothetical protein
LTTNEIFLRKKGHHGHSHGRKESSGERAAARPIYRPKIEHTDSIEVDCFLPKSFDNSNGKAESSLMESLPVTSNTKLNKDNKVRIQTYIYCVRFLENGIL